MKSVSRVVPTEKELDLFAGLVQRYSGIVLTTRRGELATQVSNLSEEAKARSVMEFYEMLSGTAGVLLLDKLVRAVTVGETHFFRNKPQVDALRTHVLPELIQRNRSKRQLRIWSAGCATGEEPYTLAMLLHRLIPDLPAWRISLTATDINSNSLEAAQAGIYGDWSFRQVPDDFIEQYFTPHLKKRRIAPFIQKMVSFSRMNLNDPSFPSYANNTMGLDLILCRNVFIYFTEETMQAIVNRFHIALEPGGWLVVGHSEPSTKVFSQFLPRQFPGAILYQRAGGDSAFFPTVARLSNLALPAIQMEAPGPAAIPLQTVAPAAVSAPEPAAVLAEVEALIRRKSFDKALAALDELLRASPKLARAHYLCARICASKMQWNEALDSIRDAAHLDPLDSAIHYLQGLVLRESGDVPAAVESFRRCTFLEPNHTMAHYMSAVCLLDMGAKQRAEKAARRAIETMASLRPGDAVHEADGMSVAQLTNLISAWSFE